MIKITIMIIIIIIITVIIIIIIIITVQLSKMHLDYQRVIRKVICIMMKSMHESFEQILSIHILFRMHLIRLIYHRRREINYSNNPLHLFIIIRMIIIIITIIIITIIIMITQTYQVVL